MISTAHVHPARGNGLAILALVHDGPQCAASAAPVFHPLEDVADREPQVATDTHRLGRVAVAAPSVNRIYRYFEEIGELLTREKLPRLNLVHLHDGSTLW